MSQNTVRKYVLSLEGKSLILTEPTTVYTKSGEKRNGSLLYTIRPIQEALEIFYARQMARVDEEAEKQRVAAKLAKLGHAGCREGTPHRQQSNGGRYHPPAGRQQKAGAERPGAGRLPCRHQGGQDLARFLLYRSDHWSAAR